MARQPSLLIVDDEANVALTLQMVFERDGYAVRTANSCASALKLLENGHNFDAVITDLNMEKGKHWAGSCARSVAIASQASSGLMYRIRQRR